MAIFVGGFVATLLFYGGILLIGIWASFKKKNSSEEEVMLAGRNIGLLVGVLTLVATWVGGGYINGVAECMFTSGLAQCQMPVGYSASLIIGCLLFVKPLRNSNYVTILDPFEKRYGALAGSVMFFPAFVSDLLWIAAVLNALGSSLTIILNIDMTVSVIISAVFAAAYTMVGGLYSVSYTDVIQMGLVVVGLMLSVPFAYNNSNVSHSVMSTLDWAGHVDCNGIWIWLDNFMLLAFGGTSGQAYVQRILSMKSTRTAQILSFISVFGTLAVAILPAMAGVTGKATDWLNVPDFERNITREDAVNILPLVLRYLTPEWVACFGLGAIAAAAMSSADASILSSSSMFSRNIYKVAIRPQASEQEVVWTLRFCVVVVTVLAVSIGLTIDSVYYLSVLSSELVYVILFPHLFLVVHCTKYVNTYGCMTSFVVGLLVRILSGESALGIPAVLEWPMYDSSSGTQNFPFRTACMLCTVATHLAVSWAASAIFERGWASAERWDVLRQFPPCLKSGVALKALPRHLRDTPVLEGPAGKYSRREPAVVALKTSLQ